MRGLLSKRFGKTLAQRFVEFVERLNIIRDNHAG
jgi:hypothetical protein